MRFLKFYSVVIISLVLTLQVAAQYIHEILEYRPAPGQHINGTAGTPDAAQSIIGTTTGLVTLGAFGGYVTFRFASPLANNPDNLYGIDFTIFGNSVGQWSEPGIVSVMHDLNGNGIAEGLAGDTKALPSWSSEEDDINPDDVEGLKPVP